PTCRRSIPRPFIQACVFSKGQIFRKAAAQRVHSKSSAHRLLTPALCRELNALRLPGVFFRENYFQPTFHKFAGELCSGAQLHVTDRNAFHPFQTGVEIIRALRKLYPKKFAWKQPPYEYEWKRLPI